MKKKVTKQKKDNCPICGQYWKRGQSSIQCNLCSCWIHRPNGNHQKTKNKNCSLLTLNEFESLSENSDTPWVCAKCHNQNLPFFSENLNDLLLNSLGINTDVTDDFQIIPDNNHKTIY